MLPLYEILDWNETFENNRSRAIKNCRWCGIPNSFGGSRISELIERGGCQAYATWCAFVLICSRSPIRGQPLKSGGLPHTLKSLARITGLPAEEFAAMLQLAAHPEIALVKEVTHNPQDNVTPTSPQCHPIVIQTSQDSPSPDAKVTIEEKGKEGKERKGEKAPTAPPSPSSLNFHPSTDESYWAALPKAFNTPAFTHAWTDYLSALEATRKPLPTARSLPAHWKLLAAYPLTQAILAVEQSTAHSWQQIFPDKITPAQIASFAVTTNSAPQLIPEPTWSWRAYCKTRYTQRDNWDTQPWPDLPAYIQKEIIDKNSGINRATTA